MTNKFYKLTLDEHIKACNELIPAERDVLYYLKTYDPYNKGIDFFVSDIAKTLGRNKGTISRALKTLAQKNWISLDIIQAHAKRIFHSYTKDELIENKIGCVETTPDNDGCVETTPVAYTQPELCTDNNRCVQTTNVAYTQQVEAETIDVTESQNSKNLRIKNNIYLKKEKKEKMDLISNTNTNTIANENAIANTNIYSVTNNKTEIFDEHTQTSNKTNFASSNTIKDKDTINSGLVPLKEIVKGDTQKKLTNWIPEGTWNINGEIDPAFVEWLAKKWVIAFEYDLPEARANVVAHFKNDPDKLPIRWKQYQEEYCIKIQNLKERIDNDCTIPPKQKEEAMNNISALKDLDHNQLIQQKVIVAKKEEIPINPKALERIAEFMKTLRK